MRYILLSTSVLSTTYMVSTILNNYDRIKKFTSDDVLFTFGLSFLVTSSIFTLSHVFILLIE